MKSFPQLSCDGRSIFFSWTLPLISLCPNAPYPVGGRSVYSPSLRSCVRLPPHRSGQTPKGWKLQRTSWRIDPPVSFILAGWSLYWLCVHCHLMRVNLTDDRLNHECAMDSLLNLSLISGQECYDPLTKLSILPFVWTCLSPCWL